LKMGPNFNLLNMGDQGGGNHFEQGFAFGRNLRQEREQKEQEAAIDNAFRGMMSGDPNAINALAQVAPRQAYGMQQQQIQSQRAQQEAEEAQARKRAEIVAQLLDDSVDEPTYQRGLAVAQSMGIDVSGEPANFDPEYVEQQKLLTRTFLEKPEKLTAMAQQLAEAGYAPGTPEFIQQMKMGIEADRIKTLPYQAGGGAVAYNSATGETKVIVDPSGGQEPIRVSTPEEAMKLPPGTQFIDPNGKVRQVPGGAASNGSSKFPDWL
jgi:hypothetical protein